MENCFHMFQLCSDVYVCLKAEPWLAVKGELGLVLVREMTMLQQSRNKGVGLKISITCFITEKSSKPT